LTIESLVRPREAGIFEAQRGRVGYGIAVGILCLECNVPFVPGDVGNASTYDYPVAYHLVPGATCEAVIDRKDRGLEPHFIEAARYLAGQGVRAITGDCGYMATYQRAVAAAVEVPVLLSSLLQIPLLLGLLGGERRLGVICANEGSFTDDLLDAAGVPVADRGRLLVRGLQEGPCWRETIGEESGRLDFEGIRGEVVALAAQMREECPELGGFLLECSDLPPYSAAIQAAVGLPVFDWIGFIDYVQHAVVSREYAGFH
jgi:hypothetical protein